MMNDKHLIGSTAAVLCLSLFLSCTRQAPVESAPTFQGAAPCFKAVFEAESKTVALNGGLSMSFSEGDLVSVSFRNGSRLISSVPYYAANVSQEGCDLKIQSGLTVSAENGCDIYSVHIPDPDSQDTPFTDQSGTCAVIEDWVECTKGATTQQLSQTVDIPSAQIQTKEGSASSLCRYVILASEPATLVNGSAVLAYSPVCAQINVQLKNSTSGALSLSCLTLSSVGNPDAALSGTFTLDLTQSPKLSNQSFALTPVETSNEITLTLATPLTLAAGATAELYFVTNAFSSSSLTLSFGIEGGRHIIRKSFANGSQDFTRAVRRHLQFVATDGTFVSTAEFNSAIAFPHADGEPYDTYEGLVMAGYQGWHTCKGDGSVFGSSAEEGFAHYYNGIATGDPTHAWDIYMEPGALRNAFNLWPDCSEYEKKYAAPNFTMRDGSTACLYSDYDRSSVFTHFRWMKEYGIDGVFSQRFLASSYKGYANEYDLHSVNLDHQMAASNEYGRAICVMYDLVGLNSISEITAQTLYDDLDELEAKYHFKDRSLGQKYYLHHNGKPLVGLVSFAQADMPYDMTDCRAIVKTLKDKGYSVMIGVPTYWRDGTNDSPYTSELLAMIDELHPDVLMPWFVGRYDYDGTTPTSYKSSVKQTSFDSFKARIKDDADWCSQHGVDYAPNIFPGFDWSHQKPYSVAFDRHGGDFLWKQAYYDIAVAGAKMIYVAMFDEIDEGTAIYKVLRKRDAPSNIPATDFYVKYEKGTLTDTGSTGPSNNYQYNSASKWWVKSSEVVPSFGGVEDEYTSDYYLWLTGRVRAMLRGDIPMTQNKPIR